MKPEKNDAETFKIENVTLTEEHVNSKVTYIPTHANGDASHPDVESGTIMHWNDHGVMVNYVYNKCRTRFSDLVWG